MGVASKDADSVLHRCSKYCFGPCSSDLQLCLIQSHVMLAQLLSQRVAELILIFSTSSLFVVWPCS